MFQTIAVLVIVVIAVLLVMAATKPDTFRIQRATTVNAPPEEVFALINDFHRWGTWSPWEKKDPAMKRTFGGPPNGKGAIYEWEGNRDVGKGSMEITDVTAPSKVTIKLDFVKPITGHNTAEFTLNPHGETTDVTWTMSGPTPFISKLMQVFVDVDRMVGKDFEAGLANLKTAAEKQG
ncbi:SRPBCC family protein [Chitinivorax sp. B]|uniref:SRPBCC family protein n=1 Tax=Chitinivorax sp. B TaxID=2502235 RepID=UPI0010F43A80|nr:SRPBCC family protein [Chitinivorax sp. B]